jgi:folate-binding protein YgfZ
MPTVLLSDRGVIEVAGPDAADFLNRLLTNQVPEKSAQKEPVAQDSARLASHAALLTPQGKVLASFMIVRHPHQEDGFLLDCARSCLAESLKRFTLYKLRAACTVKDVSDLWHVHAVWPSTQPLTAKIEDSVAFDDPRHAEMGMRILSRHRLASEHDPSDYDNRRIGFGLAEDGKDFASSDVFPHEINLDHTNGLDFHKGCYVGQEVVSRMHHRGTARNRMVVVDFAGENPPAAGSEIKSGALLMGHLGSVGTQGTGLALLRIDRVQEALAKAQELTVNDMRLIPHLPDWITPS